MIKWTIHNKVLWHYTEVMIADSDKEFDKAIKETNKIRDIDCQWTHKDIWWVYTWSNETKRWYIILNGFVLSEVSHEIVHLIFQLFEARWIPVRHENDEIFAYHMWFYMQEIIDMYSKANAKK